LQFDPNQTACCEWPSVVTCSGITDPILFLCESVQVALKPGHRFLVYSDGLIEAQNSDQ